jgi:mRNA interferase MazF
MKLETGDLILVPFPFSDLTSKKTRPALVLSSAQYNSEGVDVIACAITSNLSNAAHSVLIDSRDLVRGRIPARGRIKVDKIATLEKTMVRKVLSRVKPTTFKQVMAELATLFPNP